MIFDKENVEYLKTMGINVDAYEKSLVEEFSNDTLCFQKLIQAFKNAPGDAIKTELFNSFYESIGHPAEGAIHEKLFDLFNYVRLFNGGGKIILYKGRQAEWDGPKIRLSRSDVPNSDIHLLVGNESIYRGMSTDEFHSGDFGQSWTTDILTARRFASEVYGDKPTGVIAGTKLNLSDVIYYSKSDQEHEVIVAYGRIHFDDVFKA